MSLIARTILILLFTAFLLGCRDNSVTPPRDIIQQEKMIDVMVDIHLLEGARSGNSIIGSDSLYIQDYYSGILQDHDLTIEEYQKSFSWYTQHPTILKDIYEGVMDKLSVMQAEAQQEAKKNQEKDQEVID